jgi:hypothetical protein
MAPKLLPRSAFLSRLFAMATESSSVFPGVCGWTAQGDSFLINDKDAFEQKVLPHFTASSNLKSFVRQMNRHGFRKERNWSNLIE